MEIRVAAFVTQVHVTGDSVSLLGVSPPSINMTSPVRFVLMARFPSMELDRAKVHFSLCDPDGIVLGETLDQEPLRINGFDGSADLLRIWNIEPPLLKEGHYQATLDIDGHILESTLLVKKSSES